MATPPEVLQPTQLLEQAKTLLRTGPWQSAHDLLAQAIDQVPTENTVLLTTVLLHLGLARRMLGNYTDSHEVFERAGLLAWQRGDKEQELEALVGLMDLARNHDRDPKYEKNIAEAYRRKTEIEELLDTNPSLRDTPVYVKALIQFGLMDLANEKPAHALNALVIAAHKAETFLLTDGENVDLQDLLARAEHIKGLAAWQTGNRDQAQSSQKRAFELYMHTGNRRGIGNAAIELGDMYMQYGDPSTAGTWYDQAFLISGDSKTHTVIDSEIHDLAWKRILTTLSK